MTIFPCAKINLGLNIVSKRPDGYHNLETVFYPIPLTDGLEIKSMDQDFPSEVPCDLKITGNAVDCNESQNLVVKAYDLIANDFDIPRVHAHLYKKIPSQAGLGGGSSDGAFMIRLLNERFHLNIGVAEMERYATKLGADSAFFITATPAYASGIGNLLEPIDDSCGCLTGYHVVIVKPDIAVSTRDAYRMIMPKQPSKSCRTILQQPIETWKNELINDFEPPVFSRHPELRNIKEHLYSLGADYAQMSGSGSALFGIFKEQPRGIEDTFKEHFTFMAQL